MPAPQQGTQSDHSASVLWGVAAVFAALGGIWFAFKTQIVSLYLTIKLYEVDFLNFISGHLGSSAQVFDTLRTSILSFQANPQTVSFNDLISVGAQVGDWLRIPLVILLLVLAFVVYVGNKTRAYKRTYTMKELAQLEKVNWPQIVPVVHLDLIKTDIDTGPWAMALTPLQFCKKNRLLEEVRPRRREGMGRKDWERVDVVLKRGDANKLFTLQLGQLWKGIDHVPPYARALFAVFAARINADSKAAGNMLIRLNTSSTNKQLDLTGVTELLKKHEHTKLVQQIVQSHAYTMTVMASMLEAAREDGVQASADFLWLKPLDRRLWYTLNTVGRQTPFIEVAGIFAHWKAEKEAGRKLLVPMIDEATRAVELALKEVVYRPDVD